MPIDYAPLSSETGQKIDQEFKGFEEYNSPTYDRPSHDSNTALIDNLYADHQSPKESLPKGEHSPENCVKLIETAAVLIVDFREYELAA